MVRMSVFSCIPYLCQIDKDVPTRMFQLVAGATFYCNVSGVGSYVIIT